ncbi:reprolysin-like metallopeptidase [Polaribacter sp. R77954]|uniref:reprolysin-like metallopeptidase n=1 Tax=Polaribacter sp. R77954 TaxID=3093870 RepID=UPI0037CB748C
MKNRLSLFLFLGAIFLGQQTVLAQKLWIKQKQTSFAISKKEIYQKEKFPTQYQVFSLNKGLFENSIRAKTSKEKFIELPDANGNISRFRIEEHSNFDATLQAKYPNITAYTAQSISNPNTIAKISLGTDGFHAVIFSKTKPNLYIDPYTKDNKNYIVYQRTNLPKADEDFKCLVESHTKTAFSSNNQQKTNDGKFRTFRMALACTGEYAQFHLGPSQQNISDSATDQEKKAAILSAMNTSMTRINGVLEREIAIKLELVGNNDAIIFLDAATDGMTDSSTSTLINEIQAIVDANIGDANYDVGHVFSTGGGSLDGAAILGSACITSQKARGVTGLGAPVGDAYDIDLVIHELGHQFGATHTQNNDCNRTDATAVEPGSGSTIMGYAGICSPNVQSGNANGNSDDYFHAVSIAQILNLLDTSASCATLSDTNNTQPTANAGTDFSIPKSTPFKLTGTATDVDGTSSLTYNWEQIDNETATMPPVSTNAIGPLFRSLPSKDVPVRYFPDLATIVSGSTSTTWEVLPSVARQLDFAFTVRDNDARGGSTARDDVKIEVVDATPFSVTAPTTAVTWDTGSTQTITWSKGDTDISPINCALVNIKLSIDGGVTFPITLKSNSPNDGTEEVLIPDNATETARIMVEAADNIFYNVNAVDFTIRSTAATFIMNNTDGLQIACNSGDDIANYNLNFDFINGFTETVSLSASGQPEGATITFSSSTISADGDITMIVSNLNEKTIGDYEINVIGTSNSVTQPLNVNFKLISPEFNSLTLTSPSNGATETELTETLIWNLDNNATSYDIEVAKDASFSNIISSATVSTNSYLPDNISSVTQYFWRVKPKNKCGEGVFSDTFSFTTKQGVYCSSFFTDEAGGSEYILNVTFAGINNDSGNDTTNGYQDFTAINTVLVKGIEKEISVTFDTAGYQDHCYVFIDWNQDFEFDIDTERYNLGTRTEDIATTTLNISVPNNARIGETRMRVVLEYDDPTEGFGEGACDNDHLSEWGETEDYTLIIVEPIGDNNFVIQTTSESCQDLNDGIITVTILDTSLTYALTITGTNTNKEENLTNANYELANLAPGNYEICIETVELNTTHCYEVVIEEALQIDLKIAAKNESNSYSFEILKGTPPFEVFLNNELIGVSSSENFDLNINESGILTVKTAIACEGVFEKNIDDLLSTNNSTPQITVIKNPVQDFIELRLSSNINNQNFKTTIFDITGKLIYNQNFNTTSDIIKIPFNNFAKGIYILKLSLKDAKPIKILKQ